MWPVGEWLLWGLAAFYVDSLHFIWHVWFSFFVFFLKKLLEDLGLSQMTHLSQGDKQMRSCMSLSRVKENIFPLTFFCFFFACLFSLPSGKISHSEPPYLLLYHPFVCHLFTFFFSSDFGPLHMQTVNMWSGCICSDSFHFSQLVEKHTQQFEFSNVCMYPISVCMIIKLVKATSDFSCSNYSNGNSRHTIQLPTDDLGNLFSL